MGLRYDPIGGGQFKAAIKQIIEAESQPIKSLETHKAREEARLKLFQEFKNKFAGISKAIDEISNFKKFRELKVDLGDGTSLASVTIDKDKAQPGQYQIEVDQMAARTSVISNGFEDPDATTLGVGYVVMNLENGENAEVYVDEDHSSLHGIANAINAQDGSPIRAAVIKDAGDEEAPWKLILTAKKDGKQNQVDFPEFYFLDGSQDLYVDDNRDARNAMVVMDGFPVELEGNDVNEFLPGVNLHLKQARPDQPFTLTITEDVQKIGGKIKAVVDQLNQVLQFIVQQNQLDDKSDTRSTFGGDTGMQTIEYRLRNLLHEGYPVGDPDTEKFRIVYLNQLGVEFGKDGSLGFKDDKFTKALEKDYEGVSEAISGQFGLAASLQHIVESYTKTGSGMLALREQGLHARIKDIDSQIEVKTRMIDRRQQQLTDQFSRLEGTLSDMQRQQQALGAMMPSGGGGNLVQQLLGG